MRSLPTWLSRGPSILTSFVLQTRFWLWRFGALPSGLAKSADDVGAFAIDMAATLPATFAVAYVSYRLIERPAASAARRLEPVLFGSTDGVDGGTTADAGKTKAA